MAKPFDATAKHLVEDYPRSWLAYPGLPAGEQVEVVNADLSTVTTEADKVPRVETPTPWLAQIEFQTRHDPGLVPRLPRYNVLLNSRHGLPVRSVIVLLRREADGPDLTGRLRQTLPDRAHCRDFRYTVVRVWRQDPERVLAGSLGTLPLAPLAAVSPAEVPAVLRRMAERIQAEAARSEATLLWAATSLLLGLRYPPGGSHQVLEGVRTMWNVDWVRDSSTPQMWQAEVAQRIVLAQGQERFGPPDTRIRETIEDIWEVDQLERLAVRLLKVSSWDELLAES